MRSSLPCHSRTSSAPGLKAIPSRVWASRRSNGAVARIPRRIGHVSNEAGAQTYSRSPEGRRPASDDQALSKTTTSANERVPHRRDDCAIVAEGRRRSSPSRSARIDVKGASGDSKASDVLSPDASPDPEDLIRVPRMRVTAACFALASRRGPWSFHRTRRRWAPLRLWVGEAIDGCAFAASLKDHRIAALAHSRDCCTCCVGSQPVTSVRARIVAPSDRRQQRDHRGRACCPREEPPYRSRAPERPRRSNSSMRAETPTTKFLGLRRPLPARPRRRPSLYRPQSTSAHMYGRFHDRDARPALRPSL